MALDSAKLSRLNAFAVYALAFAIAWLPGQTCVGSSVVVTYRQISPSRLTTAPHILAPPKRPPASGIAAASRIACCSSDALGRWLHVAAKASVHEHSTAT